MADEQQDPEQGEPAEPTPHPESAEPADNADPAGNAGRAHNADVASPAGRAHNPDVASPAGPGPDAAGGARDGAHLLPDEEEYPGRGSALPPAVERWRRRSATGAMLTGFAMGLREVIEPDHREPAIVLETSGVPPRDLAVEADLDNVPPRQSVVRVRRWLLHDPDSGSGAAPDGADAIDEPAPAPGPGPTEIRQRRRRSRSGRIFGGKGS